MGRTIEAEKINMIYAVPTVLYRMLEMDLPSRFDLYQPEDHPLRRGSHIALQAGGASGGVRPHLRAGLRLHRMLALGHHPGKGATTG
jgi:hypothetical protein